MSDSAIYIRRATTTDADTLVRFNLAIAAETERRALALAIVSQGVQRLLANPAYGVYYVAERNGNMVGQLLVTFEFSDWRDGQFWWIQSVYVEPAARRCGVYRALHEHVARAARAAGGVCGLRLYVDRENARAQEVYRRLGLRQTNYDLYEADWSDAHAT